jgi:hypothetical protein
MSPLSKEGGSKQLADSHWSPPPAAPGAAVAVADVAVPAHQILGRPLMLATPVSPFGVPLAPDRRPLQESQASSTWGGLERYLARWLPGAGAARRGYMRKQSQSSR